VLTRPHHPRRQWSGSTGRGSDPPGRAPKRRTSENSAGAPGLDRQIEPRRSKPVSLRKFARFPGVGGQISPRGPQALESRTASQPHPVPRGATSVLRSLAPTTPEGSGAALRAAGATPPVALRSAAQVKIQRELPAKTGKSSHDAQKRRTAGNLPDFPVPAAKFHHAARRPWRARPRPNLAPCPGERPPCRAHSPPPPQKAVERLYGPR